MNNLYQFQNQLIAATSFLFRRTFIDKVKWDERLIGILGPRGVGKTTSLLQHLTEKGQPDKSRLYVTMDNLANPYSTIFSLAEDFYRKGGKQLIIDEIQKYPGWAAELKSIYDLFPGLKVVFSGSSILKLMMEGVDLSRRAVTYHLVGLSFREFLQIQTGKVLPSFSLDEILKNHEAIAFLIMNELKPLQFLPDYLKWGYFPFFLQSTETYAIKLQSVINYVIENEIPALVNIDIRNIHKIKRALQIIAANVPFQPNITKLSEALELNRNTLLIYLGFLEKTAIINSLYNAGSFYGKLTKPGKILLSHPNLSFALSQVDMNTGSVREAFFVNQVMMNHKVELSNKADFFIDNRYSFEIGGRGKTRKQIAGLPESYFIIDGIEQGFENKIPLWLFGFLY